MNYVPDNVRCSGRQKRPTKFFVPHFDESYKDPESKEVQLNKKPKSKKRPLKREASSLQQNKKQKCDVSNVDGEVFLINGRDSKQNREIDMKNVSSEGKSLGLPVTSNSDKNKQNDNLGEQTNGQNISTSSELGSKKKKKRKTKLEVIKEKLKRLGDDPYNYNGYGNCVRAAVYRGFVKLTGQPSDLDQVVVRPVFNCGHDGKATLRDLLKQPDYAGLDYEDGCQNATVFCDNYNSGLEEDEECRYGMGRTYVTNICTGNPYSDTGKSHNHCYVCKNFGMCIGDYREAHCDHCGKHYFRGVTVGYNCECQGSDDGSDQDQECTVS